MGLTYSVESGKALVRVVGTGTLTMPEMIAVIDQVVEDPEFRSDFSVIFDIRDAEYTGELEDGNKFVAALDRREKNFQKRFALVVPPPLELLGTLFCLLAEVRGINRIKCFTDMRTAYDWLGVSGDPLTQ